MTTRDDYRTSLTAMTDADLVTHAIADYLLARRSRGQRGAYDLVEFPIHVCVRCQTHTEIADKVQAVLDGANRQLNELVGLWKKVVQAKTEAR